MIILEDIGPTVTGGKDGSCFPEDRSATTYLKYVHFTYFTPWYWTLMVPASVREGDKEKDNHNTIVPALLGIEPNIN
jgi:hypothetical protein